MLTNFYAFEVIISFLLLFLRLFVWVMSQHFLTICKTMCASCDQSCDSRGLTCFLDVLFGGSVSQFRETQDDVMVLFLPLGGVKEEGVHFLPTVTTPTLLTSARTSWWACPDRVLLQPLPPQVRQVSWLCLY